MTELLAVMTISLLAVISPGADFAIVSKNSYLYGRKTGIVTSLGIALGVMLHVSYALVAIAMLIHYIPKIISMIQYIGAVYLIYLGYTTFRQPAITENTNTKTLTCSQAWGYGFLTNALNPKTGLFVISVYTQIVSTDTPRLILIGYGIFMSSIHFFWFSFVSLAFSSAVLRHRMLIQQVMINRVIGCILAVLGIMLLTSKL